MKWLWTVFAMAVCFTAATASHAADSSGKLGLNYTLGPSFVAGGSEAEDAARVGPHVGAGLEYGITRNIAATFAYDDLEQGYNSQTITFGGTFRPMPQQSLSPFINGGLGFGNRYNGDGWDHFALQLTGGVEHFFTDNLSLAGLLSYFYIHGDDDRTNAIKSVHVITPGVRLTYYFGLYK